MERNGRGILPYKKAYVFPTKMIVRLPPSPVRCFFQVEKVVLFFLSKQGELAQLLLDARQLRPSQKDGNSAGHSGDAFFVGNGAGVDAATGGIIARETDRHAIYCSIGRQIAELMRFLQLNGRCFCWKEGRGLGLETLRVVDGRADLRGRGGGGGDGFALGAP